MNNEIPNQTEQDAIVTTLTTMLPCHRKNTFLSNNTVVSILPNQRSCIPRNLTMKL